MDNYLNQVLGERYEIKEIIGVGGMSVVYKAYDRVDDRIVAVKILKDEFLANEEFRLRFKNESKVISVLSHPNIVKVYDVSFGERLQYIVMEHVEGITLKEYIERQHVLDWKEALHFIVQILRALQHAHDKGIIHRDIKPQNILLLTNANIKVTDFGIARFNRSEKNINESGAIGSVHYMSPEQAKGEYTDSRSDLYSVGVVLYEMLTGKLPFDSESDISVALMQMRQDAVKPSKINSSIPIGLEQITMRAMQKDLKDRYQSAAEFLFDLDEFKRNPDIRFDYSYFIDKSPTKYIDPSITSIPSAPVHIDDEESVDNVDNGIDEDDEEDGERRNTTVPILVGIAVSLVVVVGLVFVLAFADPIKSLISGDSSEAPKSSFFSKISWFKRDKVEVPNFITKEYEKVIDEYKDFVFSVEYENNSKYEDGHICKQDPAPGDKISKDTVITLTVATTSEMNLIKDVTGLDYIEAETVLRSAGFDVELVPAAGEGKEKNEVLYTLPAVNTYAPLNSKVYIYYLSDSVSSESAVVPSVTGNELSVARAKIVSAGLLLGSVNYVPSSEEEKGFVLNQEPASGASVKMRTYVNITVGNGVPESSTASFSIVLPKVAGASLDNTVMIYLNNESYDVIRNVPLDGSNYALSITGSGAENTFKVYIEKTLIYSGSIDFTKVPAEISNVSVYPYTTSSPIPNVIGKTVSEAKSVLLAAGFTNVSVVDEYNSDVSVGLVCNQTPVASAIADYPVTIAVTIVVSKGVDPALVSTTEDTTTTTEVTNPDITLPSLPPLDVPITP